MDDFSAKTDRELIKEILKDKNYFSYIVDRYENKLKKYLFHLSGLNSDTVDDLLQEIFIKIYKNLNGYNPDFPFSSWVFRIAHNEMINFVKSAGAKLSGMTVKSDSDVDVINLLESPVNMPAEADRKLLVEKINKIILGMEERYKSVLVLRFLEEKSYEEIGDILRIPVGTVSVQINRARKIFMQMVIDQKILS